jgi:hypothetical protein
MIINNIAHYQSSSLKPKSSAKPTANAVSKAAPLDTYEPSGPQRLEKSSPSKDDREGLIKTVKKRIQAGYYNSTEVLDDLSSSFAKALHRTLE